MDDKEEEDVDDEEGALSRAPWGLDDSGVPSASGSSPDGVLVTGAGTGGGIGRERRTGSLDEAPGSPGGGSSN